MSWQFQFRKNVHMYSHALKCKKGNVEFDCQSEDSAKEDKVVLFWLDDLPLKENQLQSFRQILRIGQKLKNLNSGFITTTSVWLHMYKQASQSPNQTLQKIQAKAPAFKN